MVSYDTVVSRDRLMRPENGLLLALIRQSACSLRPLPTGQRSPNGLGAILPPLGVRSRCRGRGTIRPRASCRRQAVGRRRMSERLLIDLRGLRAAGRSWLGPQVQRALRGGYGNGTSGGAPRCRLESQTGLSFDRTPVPPPPPSPPSAPQPAPDARPGGSPRQSPPAHSDAVGRRSL